MTLNKLRSFPIFTINTFSMKRYLLPLLILTLCMPLGCQKEGCWLNQCNPNYVYVGLEGGVFEVTAYFKIAYNSTLLYSVNDKPVNGQYHYCSSLDMPDTSSYPYTITTKWCTLEHLSAKVMNVTVYPSEEQRVIYIAIDGIDKNGKVFGHGCSGVTIYQGYPNPQTGVGD